ncbi:hypothetical protein TNCT_556291 [Trichonephila clavata]|uniref:Uncharacterized protein n=1 Tax=Trichonephila clavata TaxID=2740835 RepID=A0A8X6LV34_TRICU|nr:hypothetical protein TNCT_556291 [Trichonephila clavata]
MEKADRSFEETRKENTYKSSPTCKRQCGDDAKRSSFFKTQENTWASECTCKLLLSIPLDSTVTVVGRGPEFNGL